MFFFNQFFYLSFIKLIFFFKELIANTLPTHSDYSNLCRALEKTKSVAELINNKLVEYENQQKIIEMHQRISDVPTNQEEELVNTKKKKNNNNFFYSQN